jgi:hypothetical protein
MAKRRPSEVLLPELSPTLTSQYGDIRAAADKREERIFHDLARALHRHATVVGRNRAISDFSSEMFALAQEKTPVSARAIEEHVRDALRHFIDVNKGHADRKSLVSRSLNDAMKRIDFTGVYPGHVTEAEVCVRTGAAQPKHHIIRTASRLSKSQEKFARAAMELVPQRRDVIYETLTEKGGRGALGVLFKTGTQPQNIGKRRMIPDHLASRTLN